jgi:hypothetical protein
MENKKELRNEWHLLQRNTYKLIGIYQSSEDANQAGIAYKLRTRRNYDILRPWVDIVLPYEQENSNHD